MGGLAAVLMVGTLFGSVLARPGQPGQDGSTRPDWAASNGPGLFDTFLEKLAANLHLDTKTVREAIVKAKQAMVDDAVKAGRLTTEQGAKIKQHIEQSGGRGPWPHGPDVQAHLRAAFMAVAEALDLKPEELRAKLYEGKGINQIARELGKDPNTVKRKLMAALESRLDKAVEMGHVTSERAAAMKARLADHVDALMNRTFGPGQRHQRGDKQHQRP